MKRSIKDGDLERLYKAGLTGVEMAKALGCAPSSISKAMKRMNLEVQKQALIRSSEDIIESRLGAADQLIKINEVATSLLDKLTEKMKVELAKEDNDLSLKDTAHLALKAVAEIRSQIDLHAKIHQGIMAAQDVADFQKEVLDAINEVAPEVRIRIVERIKERRLLRSAIRVPKSGGNGYGETGSDRTMGVDDQPGGGPFSIQGP
jgi:IS30 family transposase